MEPPTAYSRSSYPLNFRQLTTWRLKALARALGLLTAGSVEPLQPCIEAIVQRDHDYQNVVVIVRESLKVKHVAVLADSEGEFLTSEALYRDTPPQY